MCKCDTAFVKVSRVKVSSPPILPQAFNVTFQRCNFHSTQCRSDTTVAQTNKEKKPYKQTNHSVQLKFQGKHSKICELINHFPIHEWCIALKAQTNNVSIIIWQSVPSGYYPCSKTCSYGCQTQQKRQCEEEEQIGSERCLLGFHPHYLFPWAVLRIETLALPSHPLTPWFIHLPVCV